MVFKPGTNIVATESVSLQMFQRLVLVETSSNESMSSTLENTGVSISAFPDIPVEQTGKHEEPTAEFEGLQEMHRIAKVAGLLGHPALAELLQAQEVEFGGDARSYLAVCGDMAMQAFSVAAHAEGVTRVVQRNGEQPVVFMPPECEDVVDPNLSEVEAILRCLSSLALRSHAA